jgi:regulatory protein
MAIITAIESQRREERVSIFLDGRFAAGAHLEVVAALGLRIGMEVSEADLQSLIRAEARRRARESALRLLGYRSRSRDEIRQRLARKGYEPDLIQEVLEDLARLELVDDDAFSRAWVESRTTGRPMGAQRIARELRQKGVARETIQQALTERSSPEQERELAMSVARQWLKRVSGEERPVAFRRLAAALQRRGFSWSVTESVLGELLPEE